MPKPLKLSAITHGVSLMFLLLLALVRVNMLPRFLDVPIIIIHLVAFVAMFIASTDARATITIARGWFPLEEFLRYMAFLPAIVAVVSRSSNPLWYALSALLWLGTTAFLYGMLNPRIKRYDNTDPLVFADSSPQELWATVKRWVVERRIAVAFAVMGAVFVTYVRIEDDASTFDYLRTIIGLIIALWFFRNVAYTIRGLYNYITRTISMSIAVALFSMGPYLYHHSSLGRLSLVIPMLSIAGMYVLAFNSTIKIKRLATMAAAYKEHV